MSIPTSTDGSAQSELSPQYLHPTYLLRRKMLKLFGGRIDLYGPNEQPVMCCLQKAFKLKEDVRLYTDDSKTTELLVIKARHIIDFSAAYDVTDAQTGQMVGTLRRKGFASMIRDTWELLAPTGQVVGKIEEDNLFLALIRRLLSNLIPQSYHYLDAAGQEVAKAHQRFNPFIHKMDLVMPAGAQAGQIDPRLILAAAILLVLIEGRQE